MIELIPLLLSTFLMTLHGAGAAPGYNETEIGMTIILSEEQKGIIYGTYGTTKHNGNAIRPRILGWGIRFKLQMLCPQKDE